MTSASTPAIILREIIRNKIKEEESLSVIIFTAFTFFGIISAWVLSYASDIQDPEHGLYGRASIVVWGYLTAIVSLICILLVKNITDSDNMFSGSASIVGLLTIFLMIWIVSINLKHFKIINMNAVPEQYFYFSSWTYVLLVFQSFFVFVTLDKAANEVTPGSEEHKKKDLMSKISSLNNIIVFLSFILVFIQQIILDKFSVDVL